MDFPLRTYSEYAGLFLQNRFECRTSMSSPTAIRDCYSVTLEKGEDEMVVAKCVKLSVVTQGKTFDEAERNTVEAISLMREEFGEDNEFDILVRRIP